MSLTRKAPTAAKKQGKPRRQDLAEALGGARGGIGGGAPPASGDRRDSQSHRCLARRPWAGVRDDPRRLPAAVRDGADLIFTVGDDDMVRVAAWRGPPRAEEIRHDVTPVAESLTGRVIRERRIHHIPDHAVEPNCRRAFATGSRAREAYRSSMRLAFGGSRPRLDQHRPLAPAAVLRPGAGAIANVRRSGGDRDRECAAVPRDPGSAGAADGNRRRAEGHQPLGVRP